ncbi:hypothetical protein J3E69DRAFT_359243 [Trichoderma sp. SZMC 28015]
MDNRESALDKSQDILADKLFIGASAGMALAFSTLSCWMIYLASGFHHLNRVTDQADCIVIIIIFLSKAIHWGLALKTQFRHDFLSKPPKAAAAAKKVDDLSSGVFHICLNTLLIIRFSAWVEHLNAGDKSMNVNFCYACIGVTALGILVTFIGIRHLLLEVLSSMLRKINGREQSEKRQGETEEDTERGFEMATEARRIQPSNKR